MKYQFFCGKCGHSSLHDTKAERNAARKAHNPPRQVGPSALDVTTVCVDLMKNEAGHVRRKEIVPQAGGA